MSLVLELTIVSLPLTFIIATIALISSKKIYTFIFALVLGIAIDSLRVGNFGITTLFIFGTGTLIYFYERISGSDDILVAVFIGILSTLIYAFVLSYSLLWTVSLIIAGLIIFAGVRNFLRR